MKKLKSLAKTLTYVACIAPHEYGLFWDPDGTMPWKEFYWALQEDPELRFVRQTTIKELELVGLSLPFKLDGNILRLRDASFNPKPEVTNPPEKLFCGIKEKQLLSIVHRGLTPFSGRAYIALVEQRELASQIARRKTAKVAIVEVLAKRAHEQGRTTFLRSGTIYLVSFVPVEYLILPPNVSDLMSTKQKQAKDPSLDRAVAGSFVVRTHHLQGDSAKPKKSRKGPQWKKDARRYRRKREV